VHYMEIMFLRLVKPVMLNVRYVLGH
jgi:hypothetical protein